MTKAQAIDHYGSAANLARVLGITRGAVTNWGEKIPLSRQYQIEIDTAGALKADRPASAAPTSEAA